MMQAMFINLQLKCNYKISVNDSIILVSISDNSWGIWLKERSSGELIHHLADKCLAGWTDTLILCNRLVLSESGELTWHDNRVAASATWSNTSHRSYCLIRLRCPLRQGLDTSDPSTTQLECCLQYATGTFKAVEEACEQRLDVIAGILSLVN